ncbi:A16A1 dehydrogenase, partial [Neopipo cinnamomea]|nr:A16A1 dehydrogenase [Neopipo cinnamomea]
RGLPGGPWGGCCPFSGGGPCAGPSGPTWTWRGGCCGCRRGWLSWAPPAWRVGVPSAWWPRSWPGPARCRRCCGNWGLSWPWEQVQALAWGSPCRGPRVGWARGGRVVVIVLDSADLDGAAAAVAGAFPWGGCVVLAQEGVLALLERRLRARLGGLRVGDPLDPGTDVGPLPPTAPHPEGLVEAAREEGAEV